MTPRWMVVGSIFFFALSACAGRQHASARLPYCKNPHVLNGWYKVVAEIPDPVQAAKLVDAMLCDRKTERAESFLRSRIAREVVVTSFGTGDLEESRKTVAANQVDRVLTFSESPDWNYRILLMDGDIHIDAENEACILGITISHDEVAGWRITQIGDACD